MQMRLDISLVSNLIKVTLITEALFEDFFVQTKHKNEVAEFQNNFAH